MAAIVVSKAKIEALKKTMTSYTMSPALKFRVKSSFIIGSRLQSAHKSMDTELRNAYELGAASSDTDFGRNEPSQHHPSIPVELCLETNLAHDLAEAYTLKLTDRKRFETARNR
jgi:hypothetical protein